MSQCPSRPYDAIFFDAGYTLLKPAQSPSERYAHICAAHGGYSVDRDTMIATMRRVLEEFPQPGPDAPPEAYRTSDDLDRAWWREYDRRVFSLHGVPQVRLNAATDEVYTYFADPAAWQLYPEATPVLEALREYEMLLGICSNWSSGLQRVVDGLSLRQYFAFVHTSAEVGELKPGRQMFEVGLRATGLDPTRVLHVGDTYHADIVGAERAGIRGVLLNRWKRVPEEAVLVIDDLPDLLRLLE